MHQLRKAFHSSGSDCVLPCDFQVKFQLYLGKVKNFTWVKFLTLPVSNPGFTRSGSGPHENSFYIFDW